MALLLLLFLILALEELFDLDFFFNFLHFLLDLLLSPPLPLEPLLLEELLPEEPLLLPLPFPFELPQISSSSIGSDTEAVGVGSEAVGAGTGAIVLSLKLKGKKEIVS